jgi:hypothetical protein
MIKGVANKNKALESLKNAKGKVTKSAFSKSTSKTSKTPLAGIAISKVLKMDRLKPKK